ncbi:ARID/BRIGHT DNA-binding domain-containing protein [Striga asiatica]|uniref:ARID/BRIGHT DNA-binding domain-containing protein n=1 Tax=Striga asiatica TaxID=4170 RepID=A0A5A7PVT4_STRAF|nr:ARID/BRIGHT DNA-binding domain-containing protein [Striga asiatica]
MEKPPSRFDTIRRKSGLEMEDAEKLPSGSGNHVPESKSEVVDANVESKKENFPGSATVMGDVTEMENGGEDVNRCSNEEKDNHCTNAKVKEENNHNSVTNEEGSVHEEISTQSGNVEQIKAVAKDELNVCGSSVDKQADMEKEVVEQKFASCGLQENPTEKEMDNGNHVKDVAENPNEDVKEKNPERICELNLDGAERVSLGEKLMETAHVEHGKLSSYEPPQRQEMDLDNVQHVEDVEMNDAANMDKDERDQDSLMGQGAETVLPTKTDGDDKTDVVAAKHEGEDALCLDEHEATKTDSLGVNSPAKVEDGSGETLKSVSTLELLPWMGDGDDGTLEDQIAFMKEIESFHREKAIDFKPPKFYGQPLNCLKLWRAVIRLGGHETVTGAKLWRQVGESFHPPKTCTTVSWTFRIFYEKSLLEYEKHKIRIGELRLPIPTAAEAAGVDAEGSGSGKARRDAAARAQRVSGSEIGEPIIKDKSLSNMAKREKIIKSIGSLKQKRPNEMEHSNKLARTDIPKQMEHSNKLARTDIPKQLVQSVVDAGPPADWVKINVRQTKDCFEVYALVPGLLREEVRVQSDPDGHVVITGQPEQIDNPWGITPFKKVITLPAKIDTLQTSAVVSLHGRLFVRAPFEQSK